MNKKGDHASQMTGVKMVGSVDVEGMEDFPEGSYWQGGAESAVDKIWRIFHSDRSDRVDLALAKFYNTDNTWMEICLKSERFLHLLKLLKGEQDDR